MEERWKVTYWESSLGEKPVEKFIGSLEVRARDKTVKTLELLEEFGTQIGLPHAKKVVGTRLWELRIVGLDSIRLFYIAIVNKQFLLLHGYKKKDQKIQRKELKIALARLKEYQARNKN